MLPLVLRAGWAMVVRTPANGGPGSVELLAGGGGVPDLTDVTPGWAPIDKAVVLDPEGAWVPEDWKTVGTEMAAAPLWDPETTVIVGRPGGPPRDWGLLAYLAGLDHRDRVLDRFGRVGREFARPSAAATRAEADR